MNLEDIRIAVIGLGYVGLPLATEFGRIRQVIGYDIDEERITDLKAGVDHTLQVDRSGLAVASKLVFTSDPRELASANFFIITAPTPLDEHKRPNLEPLLRATETVGSAIQPGSVVVFESTVYPGATQDDCVPVLENASNLTYNVDFFVGYSPERINPGDRQHTLAHVKKITSGSTPEVANLVDELYDEIISAGTHKAPSIRVAETAKVIENAQRDVNIALINELAIICNKMSIDTESVLLAAATKWNFLPFKPGLVGGHCIGVDPYYLTHKAEELGYHPELILAGRRLNDSMGSYVASQMIKAMTRRGASLSNSRVLIMGLAFKENTVDIRNTKVIDLMRELQEYSVQVDVYDPLVDPVDVANEYGLDLIDRPTSESYDGIILAVAHREFCEMGAASIRVLGKAQHVLYDLKYILTAEEADLRL